VEAWTVVSIVKIKLLAEGSSKATIHGNQTHNLPIARLTLYRLGYHALTKILITG